MNKSLLIILFLQIPSLLLAQDKLQFVGERIDFEINSSRFTTNGIYFFANSSKREIHQSIFFPFGQGADSIQVKRVYNISKDTKLDYQLYNKGFTFKINVLPYDTVGVNIAYSQQTKPVNIYVLKSTQTWGKALQTAKYSLTFDNSVEIIKLNYQPDKKIGKVYYWNKTDFFPAEDFIITINSTLPD